MINKTKMKKLPVQADGRKWKREELSSSAHTKDGKAYLFSFYDIDCISGPIYHVIKELLKVQKYYKAKGFENIAIDIETHAGYHGDETEISFVGWRLETDEEFSKRVAKNKKNKIAAKKRDATLRARIEENERMLYDKLKKKYGKGKK